jgi:hypothetical protein
MRIDMGIDVFYRCEEMLYAPSLDIDNLAGNVRVAVDLLEFPVMKKTLKGVWLDVCGSKKFVLLTARKRFACQTKEEAIESFIARKKRQILILKNQLRNAEAALDLAVGSYRSRGCAASDTRLDMVGHWK